METSSRERDFAEQDFCCEICLQQTIDGGPWKKNIILGKIRNSVRDKVKG